MNTDTDTAAAYTVELLDADTALEALELIAAGVPADLAAKAARDGVLYGDEGLAAVLAITAASEAE